MATQSLLRRLDLYRVTLGHLAPSQMFHRGHRLVRNKLIALRPPVLPPQRPLSTALPRPFALEAVAVPPEAIAVSEGRFAFIQMPEVIMPEIDWTFAPDGLVLWSYYLHYFGYAIALAQAYAASGDSAFAARAGTLMTDWIAKNRIPGGHGWHPYPVSRRLSAWAVAIAAFQDAPAFQSSLPTILASIHQQARQLLATREYDVRGNHLLANLQALAWIRLILGPALDPSLDVALAPFLAEFWEEFLAQTKPDGSHEENTASYQMIVCLDAFETLLLAEQQGAPVPDAIKPRLEAMFTHMMSLVKPDGRLPMVNDTMQGYPMDAAELLALGAAYFGRGDWKLLAREADLAHLRWMMGQAGVDAFEAIAAMPSPQHAFGHAESGYYVIRSGWGPDADYMLFDCGPLGPRHLMAHAHADALSVELSALGAPILVDPGVYEYRAGGWRDHFRSTAAHSTVAVDGFDQSEVWSSFRVARRAEAWCETWTPGEAVAGAHDGYRRLKGRVNHRREVTVLGPHSWRIVDRLTSQAGEHAYSWCFQLAPEAVARIESATVVTVEHPNGVRTRFAFQGEGFSLNLAEAWVSDVWNEKRPAQSIKLDLTSAARVLTISTVITAERETN